MAIKVTSNCEVRGSFVTVFEPRVNQLSQDKTPEYSMQVLVPKTEEGKQFIKSLKVAYTNAISEKWSGKTPRDVREFLGVKAGQNTPCIRDGDKDKLDDDGNPQAPYAGHWFFNCKNKQRPGVIDKNRAKVLDPDDFRSGDWCYVQIGVYAYSNSGNNGVGFSLDNVMVTRRGEPLTGKDDPEDAFKNVQAADDIGPSFDDDDDDDDLLD